MGILGLNADASNYMHLHQTVKINAIALKSRSRDDAPCHRDRDAGGGGIAERQTLQPARGEEAECLRLDGVGSPAQRLGRLHGCRLQPLAQHSQHDI